MADEFTPYRDHPSTGGTVYPIASRQGTINAQLVRVARSLLGWFDGADWHEASASDPLPAAPPLFTVVVPRNLMLVANTPTKLIATPLAGRRKVTILNGGPGNDDPGLLELGTASLALGEGFTLIAPLGEYREALEASVDLWGISASALDLRIAEYR